jgi:D-apionolactonase
LLYGQDDDKLGPGVATGRVLTVSASGAARRVVRAGRLSALLDGVDLRYVRWGGVEVVRRVYVAVRALTWDTVLPVIDEVTVSESADDVRVECRVRHERDPIAFEWRGTITASAEGLIRYEMDGVAGSGFDYAKIGVCVHHPPESAGRPYRGTTVEGAVAGTFPIDIAPQIHVGEVDLPIFPSVTALTVDQVGGVLVELTFAGDRFEVEDHRNWSDVGFKSYSTPADLGYVFSTSPGERLRDAITLTFSGLPTSLPAPVATPRIAAGKPLGLRMPPVGFGMGPPAEDADLARLAELRPAHLRVDLPLTSSSWRDELRRADREASALGCAIELALILDDDGEGQLTQLASELPLGAPVARVIVLHALEEVTRPPWVAAARGQLEALLGDVPFYTGTGANFNELNRNRECVSGSDGIAFPLHPQVHAFDDLSLMENVTAQPELLSTAKTFCRGRPLAVSPVVLRTPAYPPDRRQESQFAAAWTLGSIGALAAAGAASLTYFEGVGPRGVLGFPVADAFAVLAEHADAELFELAVDGEATVGGFACISGRRMYLALANLSDRDLDLDVVIDEHEQPLRHRLGPYAIEIVPSDEGPDERT